MANLFIEGWENYPTGALSTSSGSPWATDGNSGLNVFSSGTTITGSKSLVFGYAGSPASGYIYRPIKTSTEIFLGFSVVFGSFDASGSRSGVGVSGSSGTALTIWASEIGQWVLWRGSTAIALDTTSQILTGVKYYVEAHFTSTTYEVLIDGNVIFSGSMTTIGDFLLAHIYKAPRAAYGWVDDLYYNDANGDVNNGYLGEISVLPLYPDTDELPQDWSLSSGSDAYSLIGVSTPSGSDYISAQNVDDEAAFTFEEIPFPVTDIFAVQTTYRAQKESSGESAVQLSLTQGSTTDAGAENFTAEATYAWYYDSWEKDPDTNDVWSPDTFDPKVTLKRTV